MNCLKSDFYLLTLLVGAQLDSSKTGFLFRKLVDSVGDTWKVGGNINLFSATRAGKEEIGEEESPWRRKEE